MVNIKSTSNAIWWIKKPNAERRKASFGSSFCLDMAELLRNISLQGYNKLLATELTLVERLIWLLVHTATLIGMLSVLLLTWEQFVAQYIITNMKDPLYPVENVPFPAVSICSNNRISKQAVTDYARELQHSDPTPRKLDYYLDHLAHLRKLYIYSDSEYDTDAYLNFQTFLDVFGTWNNETFFDSRRIMKRLTPSCKSYLLKCILANVEIDCFGKDAFEDNLTRMGFCCTFNKMNKYKKRPVDSSFAFASQGLHVVINASRADNFTPILKTNGYAVIIHHPDNYASISAPNSLEMHPGHHEESYLTLNARVIDTDKSLAAISPLRRRCYYSDEGNSTATQGGSTQHTVYTFPNCVSRCRIRSIIALCNCIPFQLPLEFVDSLEGLVYCTLRHVACLQQYQFKWNNVLTDRVRIPGLERESEEAVYCPYCLPSCYDVQYRASLGSLPLDIYLSSFSADENLDLGTDISVLKVFFERPHARLFMRLLNNEWFEIFSFIGNILSIFMGFSMVAIFETLFFISKYIYTGCSRLIDHGKANNKLIKLDAQKLHICP